MVASSSIPEPKWLVLVCDVMYASRTGCQPSLYKI